MNTPQLNGTDPIKNDYLDSAGIGTPLPSEFDKLEQILKEPSLLIGSLDFKLNEKRFEWRLSFVHEESEAPEEIKPFYRLMQEILRKPMDFKTLFNESELLGLGIQNLNNFSVQETHAKRKKLLLNIGFALMIQWQQKPKEFEEKMNAAKVNLPFTSPLLIPFSAEDEDIAFKAINELKEIMPELIEMVDDQFHKNGIPSNILQKMALFVPAKNVDDLPEEVQTAIKEKIESQKKLQFHSELLRTYGLQYVQANPPLIPKGPDISISVSSSKTKMKP